MKTEENFRNEFRSLDNLDNSKEESKSRKIKREKLIKGIESGRRHIFYSKNGTDQKTKQDLKNKSRKTNDLFYKKYFKAVDDREEKEYKDLINLTDEEFIKQEKEELQKIKNRNDENLAQTIKTSEVKKRKSTFEHLNDILGKIFE